MPRWLTPERNGLLVVPLLVGLLLLGLFLVLRRSLLLQRAARLLGVAGRLRLFTHVARLGCPRGVDSAYPGDRHQPGPGRGRPGDRRRVPRHRVLLRHGTRRGAGTATTPRRAGTRVLRPARGRKGCDRHAPGWPGVARLVPRRTRVDLGRARPKGRVVLRAG